MKHTHHLLLLLGLGLTHPAFGNARMSVRSVLETEQVDATIRGETATVTGRFRFRRIYVPDRNPRDDATVYVPLICPKGARSSLEDFQFSLELNGEPATSYSITTNSPIAVPDSDAYSIVWILAKAPFKAVRTWGVQVAYRQQLIDGVFYYLPILGRARPSAEAFRIRVKADRPIHSVGKKGGFIAKGPQDLLFIPANLVMIGVSVSPGSSTNNGGSQPLLYSPQGPQDPGGVDRGVYWKISH